MGLWALAIGLVALGGGLLLLGRLVPPEGGCGLDCLKPKQREGLALAVEDAWRNGTAITLPGPPSDPEAFRTVYGGDPLDDDDLAFVVAPGPSREFWLHLVFDDRRPGSPAYYGNQSLLGALERLHLAWLWVPLGLALGCVGLWRATRAHRAGAEVTAVALVGLTAVVVSPISWQHHAVWIVPAAAALIAWATTPKRAAVAILAVAVFLFPLDFWGQRLSSLGGSPLIAEVLRNSYALAFIALLLLLPLPSPSPPSSPPSPPKDAAPAGRRRLAWR